MQDTNHLISFFSASPLSAKICWNSFRLEQSWKKISHGHEHMNLRSLSAFGPLEQGMQVERSPKERQRNKSNMLRFSFA